jgi:nucleoside-diphosphate-sugar epimerase
MQAISRNWDGRICLVTGGAGFTGAHLCEQLLARGARVCVLDCQRTVRSYFIARGLHDRTHFRFGDVRDLSTVRLLLVERGVDTVFHLASQPSITMSRVLPLETLSVNALGTYTMLEAARLARCVEAFVYVSSGAVYGETSYDAPLNEDTPLHATANLYAPAQVAGEAAVQAYAMAYRLNAAICRAANTYGPGDLHFNRLVPRALRNLLLDAPYEFGTQDDGCTRLDFLFVEDLVRGYVQTAEWLHRRKHTAGETFNLGSGYPVSTRTLARMVSRAFDGTERIPLFNGAPQAEPLIRYFNVSKAADVLGWCAHTELEAGLATTVGWYRHWQLTSGN